MLTLTEIHPLSDFKKNAKGHLRRLNKTGQPEVLTVNGKPAVVVQDARSYQRLLDSVEQAEAIAGIKLGLESLARGEGKGYGVAAQGDGRGQQLSRYQRDARRR
jgi:prevent-host-death family protein